MRHQKKPSGYRQAAWDALREQGWEQTKLLAEAISCKPDSLRSFIAALEKRGYVKRDALGHISLVRNTGPLAPSLSQNHDTLHDWNLNPPMDGQQLKAIVQASGMSNAAWLESHGFSRHGAARLNQMFRGIRPVTPVIEAAAMRKISN